MPFSGSIAAMILSNDTAVDWEIYIDKNINSLDRIPSLTFATATTGGTIPAAITYFVRVTTVDAAGVESPPTVLQSKKTSNSATTNTITASWTAIVGAVSYNVYSATHCGLETLVGSTAATSFTITAPPAELPFQIATTPDLYVIAPVGYRDIYLDSVQLAARLAVYAKSGQSGNVSFSCIVK